MQSEDQCFKNVSFLIQFLNNEQGTSSTLKIVLTNTACHNSGSANKGISDKGFGGGYTRGLP